MIPSFDKAQDERRPREQWTTIAQRVDVILFEGWCVGVRPQSAEALVEPVNELERNEDPDGVWRRYVNDQVAGPYRQLFDAIDLLVLLQAPSFASVFGWRLEQEDKLRERVVAEHGDIARVMDQRELARFISHYERLTNHILEEMPARADVVLPCR